MFPWFDTAKIRIIREKQGIFAEKMCSIAKLLLASKDTLLGLKGGGKQEIPILRYHFPILKHLFCQSTVSLQSKIAENITPRKINDTINK
jgi:hypothetical protein